MINKTGDAGKLHLEFLDNVDLPENIMIYKKSWANNDNVQTLKPAKNIDVDVPLK